MLLLIFTYFLHLAYLIYFIFYCCCYVAVEEPSLRVLLLVFTISISVYTISDTSDSESEMNGASPPRSGFDRGVANNRGVANDRGRG